MGGGAAGLEKFGHNPYFHYIFFNDDLPYILFTHRNSSLVIQGTRQR